MAGEPKQCKRCCRSEPFAQFRDVLSHNGKIYKRGVCTDCRRLGRRRYREGPAEVQPSATVAAEDIEITEDTALLELVKLTRKGPIPFGELCDKLDVSPKRLRELLGEAKAQDLVIGVDGDHVGFSGAKAREEIQETGVRPVVGMRQKIACISDTHLGSKYCLRAQLIDFIHYAYDQGVREILHSGDILDGCYDHGRYELSHVGLDEQTRDLFETLPALEGLTYHSIGGNHDGTFTSESGVDVPLFIRNYFLSRGRGDWFAYGNRGALLRVRGALVELWHPSGGVAYAQSYKIQKKIESYAPGRKPQTLQIGHWHQHATITSRGIFGFSAGTFQGGGSAFARSLTSGPPAIGGTIIGWDATKDGTLRDLIVERREYYENETPLEIGAMGR